MALVRIARQAELVEGGKLVKETHGRKVLLARTGGRVYATDAACFHMGGNLAEGDIEDVAGHACIVCPLHRYKIDMATGVKVDTMLDGQVTCSSSQQQRTYAVYQDPDFICIDIPELHTQKALPSDVYNQVARIGPPVAPTPPRPNYGLFGSSASQGLAAAQPQPLAPYAGFQQRGLVPSTPARDGLEEAGGGAWLSQESGIQLSQEPGSAQRTQQQQQQQQRVAPSQQQQQGQGQITFSQSRVDTARIARRKAATAAIAARAYAPPSAPPRPVASRGLFTGASTAPAPPQRTSGGSSGGGGGAQQQSSLLNFGFTVQRSPAVASIGPESMDME
ncbi:hypothetical protein D9Q98_008597 [Chlorella vulgaris]|uniref:Rieske domain-containing protein n=1 Tax=Chlorella vulgaris TaxID=3077 RepID=A0A9D4TI98_CHLVU|nr:hypothetical protein D9Q98_008597 [Chlorella vulgaris]